MKIKNKCMSLIDKIIKTIRNPSDEIFNMKSNFFFNFLYGDKQEYVMNYKNIQTKFLTNDNYSRHWFFPHCTKGRLHESVITKMILDSLNKQDVFVDVGAHLGYYTCIAGKICHKVYGFEIDMLSFEILVKNIKYNNLSNVKVYNYGITNKKGLVKIPKITRPNRWTSIIDDIDKTNYRSVNAISLDEFFKNKKIRPSIIKIDVEGSESLVLEGMKSLLKNENITLFLEIHGIRLKEYNTDSKEIISFLNDYSYNVYEILDHRDINLRVKTRLMQLENHKPIDYNTMFYVTKT